MYVNFYTKWCREMKMFSELRAVAPPRFILPDGSYRIEAEEQGMVTSLVCFVSLGLGLGLLLYKRGGRG